MKKYKRIIGKTPLILDDLVAAELEIIQFNQRQHFGEEMKLLRQGRQLSCSSHLFKLDPLNKFVLPENARHQTILSKHSRVATQILKDVHQRTRHCGHSYVLAQVRQKYSIPQANTAIQKLISKSKTCFRINGKIGKQKMPHLSEDCLLPEKPPFLNTAS